MEGEREGERAGGGGGGGEVLEMMREKVEVDFCDRWYFVAWSLQVLSF